VAVEEEELMLDEVDRVDEGVVEVVLEKGASKFMLRLRLLFLSELMVVSREIS
jgi:hypothetical protein